MSEDSHAFNNTIQTPFYDQCPFYDQNSIFIGHKKGPFNEHKWPYSLYQNIHWSSKWSFPKTKMTLFMTEILIWTTKKRCFIEFSIHYTKCILDAFIYKHIIAKWAGAVGFALWYIVSWKNIKGIGLIDKK